jgi:hypothetical protein
MGADQTKPAIFPGKTAIRVMSLQSGDRGIDFAAVEGLKDLFQIHHLSNMGHAPQTV